MKNLRYRPLIIVSGILLLLSLGVMGNWAYRAIFKSAEPYTGELIELKPVNMIQTGQDLEKEDIHLSAKKTIKGKKPEAGRDLISNKQQQENNTALVRTHNSIEPVVEAGEIKRLKAEIEWLLKNKSGDAELKLANQKIDELEQKLNRLSEANSEVEKENTRLLAVLKKLSENRLIQDQSSKTWPVVYEDKSRVNRQEAIPVKQQFVKNTKSETPVNHINAKTNIPVTVDKTEAGFLSVESMNMQAITVTDNKEIETHQAFLTDKFVAELKISKNSFPDKTGELYIIITQPDGKVLQKSTWESGTFISADGKKVYSCRLRFDISRAEKQKLVFSINAPNFQKGNYIMQVYGKKGLITSFVKTLS